MALVFLDGFDALSTTINGAINNRKYYPNGTPSNILDTGRFGGFACRNRQWLASKSFTPQSTWICGFAIHRNDFLHISPVSTQIVQFSLGLAGQCWLAISQDELLQIWGDGVGASERLLATGTTPIRVNSWYYIEVKITVHSTAGAAIVKVGGVTDINVSGVNTATTDPANPAFGNNTADGFWFFSDFSGGGTITLSGGLISANFTANGPTYDDIYLCDTTGSVNNDFLGESRVNTILPSGAGNHTQWTPLSGSNFSNVNEVAVNDDTSYVSTNTANNIDTYTHSAIAVTHVKGVGVDMISRMDDAGPHTISPVIRISAADFAGTAQNTTSSYANLPQMYDINPSTGLAWTVSDVNAAEFGIKMVS